MRKLKCLNCNKIFEIEGRVYSSLCSKKCSATFHNRKKHKRKIAFKNQIVIPISNYNGEYEYFIIVDLKRDRKDHRFIEKKYTKVVITEDENYKPVYNLEYEYEKSVSIKLVPEYKKYFWATEDGRIISRRSKCLIKYVLNERGYHVFCTKFNGRKGTHKSLRVHRLVATAFHENHDNKPEVNHKDGIKINNVADNLEWATPKENTNHAHKTGLCEYKYGEDANGALLSNQQAKVIRNFFMNNSNEISLKDFSKTLDLSYHVVKDVVAGRSYKNV